MSDNLKWAADYEEYINNPPQPGTVLKTFNGDEARLEVVLNEGKQPFIFARCYVPCIVGHGLGWYLQAADQTSAHGWKCILMPKARQELIQAKGLAGPLSVKALRLIRYSDSKKAMLCEIAEL